MNGHVDSPVKFDLKDFSADLLIVQIFKIGVISLICGCAFYYGAGVTPTVGVSDGSKFGSGVA